MQYKFPRFPTRCATCDVAFDVEAELVSMIFPGEETSAGGAEHDGAMAASASAAEGASAGAEKSPGLTATGVDSGNLPGQEDTLLFVRRDYCLSCAEQRADASSLAYSIWHTRMPSPREPAQVVRIDTSVVFELFQRLAERQDPARAGYVYFLTLYLMRKRVLKFLDTFSTEEGETWIVESRPEGRRYEVTDPRLPPEALEKIREEIMDALSAGEMEL